MGTDSRQPPGADALLRRYRATGDPAALGRLFDVTAPELFGVALHFTSDPALAEDVLQETFVTALESLDRHDPGRPIVPWLVGILKNKVREARRRERRKPDPARLEPPAGSRDPAVAAETNEEKERVHRALDELPEPYREVALLRYHHGLTPAEIAALKKTAPGTVRSLLHRATEKIRRTLGALSSVVLAPPGTRAPRGFSAVRTEVLRRARKVAGATAVATGTVSAMLLGEVLMKKAGIVVAALVLLVGVPYFALPPRPSPAPPAEPATVARSGPPSTPVRKTAAGSDETGGGRVVAASREAGPRIRGRVVDEKGRAIPGAAVASYPDTVTKAFALREAAKKETATTGPDGRFEVGLSETAPACGLYVSADGFSPAVDTEVRPGADVTVVLERSIALTGRVMDMNEKPVAGAKVKLLLLMDAVKIEREGTSGRDGAYRIDGIPRSGRVPGSTVEQEVLKVDASGFAPLLLEHLPPPPKSGTTMKFDIVVDPGATLTGVVVDDESGKPIGGARVVLFSDQGVTTFPLHGGRRVSSPYSRFPWAETKSAADGSFRFDHVPARGAYSPSNGYRWLVAGYVGAWKAGYAAESEKVALPADGAHVEKTLRLFPAAVVTGKVVDENGSPVAGAFVVAKGAGFRSSHPIPALYKEAPAWRGVSDAQGRYRLAGVRARRGTETEVTVTAFAGMSGMAGPKAEGKVEVGVEAGRDVRAGDVVLHPEDLARAPIVVADEDGSPVWGATLHDVRGLAWPRSRTDRHGLVEVVAPLFWEPWQNGLGKRTPRPPEPVTFVVRAAGHGPATVTVTPAEPPPHETRVTLHAGHFLKGRVLESDGSPAKGVSVRVGNGALPASEVFPEHVGLPRSSGADEPALVRYGSTSTKQDGTFAFEDLPAGPYDVEARLANVQPPAVSAASGDGMVRTVESDVAEDTTDLTIFLPKHEVRPKGSIEGAVTDADTGKPVWGASVWLEGPGGFRIPAGPGVLPNAFRFPSVPEGTWTLHAIAAGYRAFVQEISAKAGRSRIEAPVELARGVTVTGRIRLSGPGSLAGTRIVFTRKQGGAGEGKVLAASLTSDGSFRAGGFVPGTWQLSVFGPYHASRNSQSFYAPIDGGTFTVREGDPEVRVDAVVAAAGSLAVQVRDSRFPKSDAPGTTSPPTKEQESFGAGSSIRILDCAGHLLRETTGVRRGWPLGSVTLLPGSYTVVLSTPDGVGEKRTAQIEAGKRVTVRFEKK